MKTKRWFEITIVVAMLVLEELCKGKLQSRNVVIEDEADVPGRHLILALLHSLCQRCDLVLLLAYERPHSFFVNALPAELRDRILVPASLPKPASIGSRLPLGPTVSALHTSIQGSNQRVGVVIDSVEFLVCTHSPAAVPKLVKSLLDYSERGNKVEQVVSLIHRDVHDEAVCQLVLGRPSTLIQLQPPSSLRHRYGCVVTHGEPFRNPAQSMEDFNISSDFHQVVDVTSVVKKSVKMSTAAPSAQVDPTANLTFNLSLRPEEKEAKDQVVLPYTQVSSTESQGGQIHYIPDDADDFDDEDPDDDLDF